MDLTGKTDVFYSLEAKTSNMDRLEKCVPAMDKQSIRTIHNSIYKKEVAPDYYDSMQIAKTATKMKTMKKDTLIDISKQEKRDLTKMLKTTEQYNNVLRDNERAEYIKKLLGN